MYMFIIHLFFATFLYIISKFNLFLLCALPAILVHFYYLALFLRNFWFLASFSPLFSRNQFILLIISIIFRLNCREILFYGKSLKWVLLYVSISIN